MQPKLMPEILHSITLFCFWISSLAWAQEQPTDKPVSKSSNFQKEKMRLELGKAKAELEKAQAESEKAKAEAQKAKLEVQKLKAFLETSPEKVESSASDRGVHTHDGLFLRMTAGPGFGNYNATGQIQSPIVNQFLEDPSANRTRFGGSISLGGCITEQLVLHGDAWADLAMTKKQNSLYQEMATSVVGGGFTYYWMPNNFFISGSVGLAMRVFSVHTGDDWWGDKRVERDMGTGVGIALLVGKEWWTSDNWALGAAVGGYFSYTEGDNLILRDGGAKAIFSASYN